MNVSPCRGLSSKPYMYILLKQNFLNNFILNKNVYKSSNKPAISVSTFLNFELDYLGSRFTKIIAVSLSCGRWRFNFDPWVTF